MRLRDPPHHVDAWADYLGRAQGTGADQHFTRDHRAKDGAGPASLGGRSLGPDGVDVPGGALEVDCLTAAQGLDRLPCRARKAGQQRA